MKHLAAVGVLIRQHDGREYRQDDPFIFKYIIHIICIIFLN